MPSPWMKLGAPHLPLGQDHKHAWNWTLEVPGTPGLETRVELDAPPALRSLTVTAGTPGPSPLHARARWTFLTAVNIL